MGTYIVTNQAGFFHGGVLYPTGSLVEVDDKLVKDEDTHLEKFDGSTVLPRVQVSPVAPTGPNPTAPQQIPPDAGQTVRGFEQPGAQLVGEVTQPEKQRIAAALLDDEDAADTQGAIVEKLEEATANNAAAAAAANSPATEENGGDSGGETEEQPKPAARRRSTKD